MYGRERNRESLQGEGRGEEKVEREQCMAEREIDKAQKGGRGEERGEKVAMHGREGEGGREREAEKGFRDVGGEKRGEKE